VIHGGNGKQSGKERGLVLEKEEMVKNGFKAPDSRVPQHWIGGYSEKGKTQGFLGHRFCHKAPYTGKFEGSILLWVLPAWSETPIRFSKE
jgi:hypothetical protein